MCRRSLIRREVISIISQKAENFPFLISIVWPQLKLRQAFTGGRHKDGLHHVLSALLLIRHGQHRSRACRRICWTACHGVLKLSSMRKEVTSIIDQKAKDFPSIISTVLLLVTSSNLLVIDIIYY